MNSCLVNSSQLLTRNFFLWRENVKRIWQALCIIPAPIRTMGIDGYVYAYEKICGDEIPAAGIL